MKKEIQKIAVIGAGVMGAGIAALIASSGQEVVLFDIITTNSEDKNLLLKNALQNITKGKQPALVHPDKLKYITIGNLTDDLKLLETCDLVIEAIIEKIELKWELYNKIDPYLKDRAIIASNTSTLPLKLLKQNLPEALQAQFIITHFFNPPRFMELVELITDQNTNRNVIETIKQFLENDLGKTIVKCNDTPGFIANRLGCFLLELVVRQAILEKLEPTKIDQIFSNLLKLPKTGIFGLYDLIGHDVMHLISTSLLQELPKSDDYHKIYIHAPLLDEMRKQNYIGKKSGQGFYKIDSQDKRNKQVISFKQQSEIHYEKIKPDVDITTIEDLLTGKGTYQLFFQKVLIQFYRYLFALIPSVTERLEDVDTAIKLGYNWRYGPYELLTSHIPNGVNWLEIHGIKLRNYIPNSMDKSHDYAQNSKVIFQDTAAALLQYHDSLVFNIKTKMCSLNFEVFVLLEQAVSYAEKIGKDLIIYSSQPNFSAGADLGLIVNLIETQNYTRINQLLIQGQHTMQRLKYANINIISCAKGFALGGGAEILLHSNYIIAHQNFIGGLVEVSLGLIPSFGGMKEMFVRAAHNPKILVRNLSNILQYNKSRSAEYFTADYGIENAKIIMNKNHLLNDAIQLKLSPKSPKDLNAPIHLPVINLENEIDVSAFNDTQLYLLSKFQEIIDRKTLTQQELLDLERKYFIELCNNPQVLAKLKAY